MKIIKKTYIKFIICLFILLFIYTSLIEPNQLRTENIHIPIHQEYKNLNHLKIIQFSDTHLKNTKEQKQLENIVHKINAINPDLVLFTGDLIDDPSDFIYQEQIIEILNQIHARYGKYAVYGNHDHGGYGTKMYAQIMQSSGVHLLQNESIQVQTSNGLLNIVGIDDMILGQPDFALLNHKKESDEYTILLAHEPDFAQNIAKNCYDLIIAGHSHGGQIRLPFLGPLILPTGAKAYTEGLYELEEKDTLLYVNTGTGTTRIHMRFLVPPCITQFEFKIKS